MLKPLSIALLTLLTAATSAQAVRIHDLTRLGGQRTNILTGMGLVVGLKGTGDGGKYESAIRPLAQMLAKMNNPATPEELKDTKNIAVVTITAKLPENGVRDGEAIDVYITSIGAANSLKGGRLYVTPMFGPMHEPYVARVRDANGHVQEQVMPFAMAEGPIVIEDPTTPTVGLVRNGATMEVDLPTEQIDRAGRITLSIADPSASWTTANTIATTINSEQGGEGSGAAIATAIDPKTVVVQIPPEERGTPDSFISRILNLDLAVLDSEARVIVNDRTGTMILTGNVEISPVIVSHKGLTISTILPEPVPSAGTPVVKESDFAAIGTDKAAANGRLQDLLDALDQLKVPADDKIAIVKELYQIGKLHAKLIVE